MSSPESQPEELAWRIPREGDWPLGRLLGEGSGRAVFWLSLAAPLVLYLALAPETRAWGVWCLVGYAFVVVVLFARRLVAVGQEPDIRLTPEGASWRSPWGERFAIPREKIVGFSLAGERQDDATAPVLTLVLDDGLESWPLDIHPPATPESVRVYLRERLGIPESPASQDESFDARFDEFWRKLEQDASLEDRQREERLAQQIAAEARQLGFFAEADLSQRAWRFEGTRARLLELCQQWEEAAARLRIAPAYARPPREELGGWAMRVTLEADEETWLADGTICGPPSWHRALAAESRERLEETNQGIVELDIPSTPWKLRWLFISKEM